MGFTDYLARGDGYSRLIAVFLQPPMPCVDADFHFHIISLTTIGLHIIPNIKWFEKLGIVTESHGFVDWRFEFFLNPSVLTEQIGA